MQYEVEFTEPKIVAALTPGIYFSCTECWLVLEEWRKDGHTRRWHPAIRCWWRRVWQWVREGIL